MVLCCVTCAHLGCDPNIRLVSCTLGLQLVKAWVLDPQHLAPLSCARLLFESLVIVCWGLVVKSWRVD